MCVCERERLIKVKDSIIPPVRLEILDVELTGISQGEKRRWVRDWKVIVC